jgi:hypothetical protein
VRNLDGLVSFSQLVLQQLLTKRKAIQYVECVFIIEPVFICHKHMNSECEAEAANIIVSGISIERGKLFQT